MSADTTAIDTSYIDNTSRLSLKIEPVTYNNDYTFRLVITDSARKFYYSNATAKYVTDSTAIAFQIVNGIENQPDYSNVELWFTNKCKGIQDQDEYLIINIVGKKGTIFMVIKKYLKYMLMA